MSLTPGTRTAGLAVALALAALPLTAQQSPLANVVLAGYGSADYSAGMDDFQSGFEASVSPVILYRIGDDLLFEAELELEVEGSSTNTALEYAQVDYLGFDRLLFSFGKFLLPFGVFGERLHPSWVNKLPTMPLMYGHAHGGVASGTLLPVLADIGALVRYNQPVGGSSLALSFYVTQGPQRVDPESLEPDGHTHATTATDRGGTEASFAVGGEQAAVVASSPFVIPGIAFGVSFPDNNKNKLLGARLGLVSGPGLEIYASGFHSMYDDEDFLDLTGGNLSLELRRGVGELRGEAAILRQEFNDNGTYRTLSTPAYYVQYAHRLGAFEPVVRWSHLMEGEVDSEVVTLERRELALGLDYWVAPSVPIKVAYGLDPDGEDRLIVQWAFGF